MKIDERRMIGTIIWENDEGDEIETEFSVQYVACSGCQGRGKHCNRAIDGNGLSSEDFAEDPDFSEAYFEGCYDVTCEECGGKRVVADISTPDDELSTEQREALDYLDFCASDDASDRATQRAERGGW